MNKKTNKIIICIAIIAILALIIIGNIIKNNKNNEEKKDLKIVTSFYPIYIMALNIADGCSSVDVSNMADQITGCIHDYTLTTADLKKIEKANVFIQSGLGLESFSEKIINAYPKVTIVDISENMDKVNLIKHDDEENAHIWLSIDNYIEQLENMQEKLSKADNKNEELYKQNANNYIAKLLEIKNEYGKLNLENTKAICLDEALEYLLKENKIEETLIETDHEQNSISAKEIKEIIEKMNEENIKIIFINKDSDSKIANTLANETGAKIYKLNSAMSGENDKNSYLEAMKENYNILKTITSENS